MINGFLKHVSGTGNEYQLKQRVRFRRMLEGVTFFTLEERDTIIRQRSSEMLEASKDYFLPFLNEGGEKRVLGVFPRAGRVGVFPPGKRLHFYDYPLGYPDVWSPEYDYRVFCNFGT